MKDPEVVFSGKATVEVEGYVRNRKDMLFDPFMLDEKYKWRAVVVVDKKAEWQWFKTKKEAVAWVKSALPKGILNDKVRK